MKLNPPKAEVMVRILSGAPVLTVDRIASVCKGSGVCLRYWRCFRLR
jgi:hypothetical protein